MSSKTSPDTTPDVPVAVPSVAIPMGGPAPIIVHMVAPPTANQSVVSLKIQSAKVGNGGKCCKVTLMGLLTFFVSGIVVDGNPGHSLL